MPKELFCYYCLPGAAADGLLTVQVNWSSPILPTASVDLTVS